MVEPETKKKTSIMPDWSVCTCSLCLQLVAIHTSSVSRITPKLLSSRIRRLPFRKQRVPTPAIADDQLSDALQCLVKVKIPASVPKKIIPLGHKYRMIGWEYNRVAFLRLDKEGKRGEFVVLLKYSFGLLVLKSAEMRWKQLENVPNARCFDIVTFRGRFYAHFLSGKFFVIDPYSLEVTLLLPSPQESERGLQSLVPYGKDELFLVEVIIPEDRVIDLSRLTRIVRRLDEEAGKWVEVSDLGDCVLLLGNLSCSAKEFPHGFGLTKNAVLFTDKSGHAFLYYKRNVVKDLN
ncbi:hypothetical protein ARALYDRAFT_900943 [Arabidopsis lyrata subsp. lyrata]|uniref:KIB1-4 beta-propeller domain-containing protein n=1 Tax=Arabidopsis lyrata subsp. lyrata TaxID=81972 RepID=D7LHI1_ARALL|nr:hypothetical protein ARALYDRAFT_900943 [Arabidopsis lyrata subsp. lyrata]